MFNFFLILFTLYKISREYPSLLKNEYAITTISQTGTSDQNYIDRLNNIEECSCRLDDNMCNYHCCCDNNCDDENKNEWRKKNLCIDEKNSLNKAPYICISKDYFLINMLKHNKIRKRRGFEIRNLEKDYCFQIDNSDYQTEKYSTKLINAVNDNEEYRKVIFDEYIESEILKIDSNPMQNFVESPINDKFTGIYLENENNIDSVFIKNNYFIVYGPDLNGNCIPIPVQFYKRIYQSKCKFVGGITLSNLQIFNDFGKENNNQFWKMENNYSINKLSSTLEGNKCIVEIEFTLFVNKYEQIIQYDKSFYRLIYFEYTDNIKEEITFNVRFNETEDNVNIGNFQSGRIGYLIGQPLIVRNKNAIKEYGHVIYKRNNDDSNACSSDDSDSQNDKPILFGESFTYTCRLYNVNLNVAEIVEEIKGINTYKKFNDINITNLGSPFFNGDNQDLNRELENQLNAYIDINDNSIYPAIIKLNIYVDSIGPSDGPIYIIKNAEFNITYDKTNNNPNILITFEIDYIFLKSAKNYKTSGSVLPKMPYDIIQPFVELDI